MHIQTLKIHSRWLFLLIFTPIFGILCVVLVFLWKSNDKPIATPPKQSQVEIHPGIPTQFTIPAINIDSQIQQVGVNPQGEMEVPNSATNVGWFRIGARPGEKGSAVITGHFDGKKGEEAVFTNLNKLKKGDKIYLKDDKGRTYTFLVRESQLFDPGYAEEVFTKNDKAYLNLITCDGVWDGNQKIYTKRLVVFSDLVQ